VLYPRGVTVRHMFSLLQYSSLECQKVEACIVVTVVVKFRQDVGFEVLTAVVRKRDLFGNKALSPLKVNRP
jgi:hypothetical protein